MSDTRSRNAPQTRHVHRRACAGDLPMGYGVVATTLRRRSSRSLSAIPFQASRCSTSGLIVPIPLRPFWATLMMKRWTSQTSNNPIPKTCIEARAHKPGCADAPRSTMVLTARVVGMPSTATMSDDRRILGLPHLVIRPLDSCMAPRRNLDGGRAPIGHAPQIGRSPMRCRSGLRGGEYCSNHLPSPLHWRPSNP